MNIDLRSDTVTQPTNAMKDFMVAAKLGDDVLGDDPTVIELEKKTAKMFGQEAGLFCPSGTMCNQIAIQVHGHAPGEVICSDLAHIHLYEGGGIAFNSGLSVKLLPGDRGRFSLETLKDSIYPEDIHFPPSQLVSIENTSNKGGGAIWDIEEIRKISRFCGEKKIPLHLDGARIFNALVAQDLDSTELGTLFDSISVCLSKGLGAPVGSVLLGDKKFIHQSRRIRKVLGGGMRQAGILAAAGIYALDHHIERLKIDHQRAGEIAAALRRMPYVNQIEEVETNIVLAKIDPSYPSEQFLKALAAKNIHAVGMGKQQVRFVSHLDFSDNQLDFFTKNLPKK